MKGYFWNFMFKVRYMTNYGSVFTNTLDYIDPGPKVYLCVVGFPPTFEACFG